LFATSQFGFGCALLGQDPESLEDDQTIANRPGFKSFSEIFAEFPELVQMGPHPVSEA
jgi:hypothetical protein